MQYVVLYTVQGHLTVNLSVIFLHLLLISLDPSAEKHARQVLVTSADARVLDFANDSLH